MVTEAHLYVTNGLIPCPNRGNIALDFCLFCAHLTAVDLDGSHPSIYCVPPLQPAGGTPIQARHIAPPPQKVCELDDEGKRDPQDAALRERIVSASMEHPEWGVAHLTKCLQSEGVLVSARKVNRVFAEEGLSQQSDRVVRLEQQVLAGAIHPDDHQVQRIQQWDACFEERAQAGRWPGERLIHASLETGCSLDANVLRAEVVIDTYSSYTFVLLRSGDPRLSAAILLQYYVLPFFADLGHKVDRPFPTRTLASLRESPNSTASPLKAAAALQSYEAFLRQSSIHLEGLTAQSGYVTRFIREFWKAWAIKLPRTLHTPEQLRMLENRLTRDLAAFNSGHALPGFPNMGQTAIERLENYNA